MPNRLTELEFDEVSLCEVGKNKGAVVQIWKAADVGKDFDDDLQEEKLWGGKGVISDRAHLLGSSISTVIFDEDVTDKAAAIVENVNQFASSIEADITGILDGAIHKSDPRKEVNMTREAVLENLSKMAASEPGETEAERWENLMKDGVAQHLYVQAFRQPGRVEVVKGDVPDFDALARSIVAKDGGSRADAFVKAVERDPDGYVRYLKSRGCPTALSITR